ncbi:hypothetical protein HPB50_013550 [Hyalomma asiaticum]|uniref:Uncharacterized protein n=1 Tax=Hyalomma asiaticum TaxID=266040 RepID=A0ACB7SNE4_HYAAI|nr:hypothetical protein HPB50_013550 [Hyalomma asiaticum]
MKKVESCGFRIIRLVTDNHKVNVQAMRLLGNGIITYRTEHPCDPDRPLFMSFDPCHVLKNVRSQFLAHDIGPKGEISASYVKDVYELQKNFNVKPVYLEENGLHIKREELTYQEVMKSLVWRYVTSEQSKNEQAPVTEDDVNELKQQITSFRYDLLDVLKDNGMKINKVQRKRAEGEVLMTSLMMDEPSRHCSPGPDKFRRKAANLCR